MSSHLDIHGGRTRQLPDPSGEPGRGCLSGPARSARRGRPRPPRQGARPVASPCEGEAGPAGPGGVRARPNDARLLHVDRSWTPPALTRHLPFARGGSEGGAGTASTQSAARPLGAPSSGEVPFGRNVAPADHARRRQAVSHPRSLGRPGKAPAPLPPLAKGKPGSQAREGSAPAQMTPASFMWTARGPLRRSRATSPSQGEARREAQARPPHNQQRALSGHLRVERRRLAGTSLQPITRGGARPSPTPVASAAPAGRPPRCLPLRRGGRARRPGRGPRPPK
ncbi:MAG: hypothetical protein DIJKHBIC_02276 [Thermoanaerobaculia bacterium]|nr:hypothetical protein [Thermoanaerobaculia bacterium]